jgi:hypothetical protein
LYENHFEHIEHKRKPHHIRKRVAFGAAVFIIAYMVGSLSTFFLKQTGSQIRWGRGATSQTAQPRGVAGVGAAAASANAPRIEIIDAVAATTSSKKAEPTTIPF